MIPTIPNLHTPFFAAGMLVDAISQHIEEKIQQDSAPAPQQRELPSFPFNGVEYRAQKSNPTLIPTPRIG